MRSFFSRSPIFSKQEAKQSNWCIVFGLLSWGLVACGPTPPDYDLLSGYEIEACGELFSADFLVKMAYDRGPTGALPTDSLPPAGTIAVSYIESSSTERTKHYPCADTPPEGESLLKELGYTSVSFALENDHLFMFNAVDRFGIEGTYSLFICSFVDSITYKQSGSLHEQGLFGSFGANQEDTDREGLIRDLAGITYSTGMTSLMNDRWRRIVDGVTLLASEKEVSLIDHPDHNEPLPGIAVCFAWIEPNLWGGCDAVRVGASRTLVIDEESGVFHQLPIHSILGSFYGFSGYCNRRE